MGVVFAYKHGRIHRIRLGSTSIFVCDMPDCNIGPETWTFHGFSVAAPEYIPESRPLFLHPLHCSLNLPLEELLQASSNR